MCVTCYHLLSPVIICYHPLSSVITCYRQQAGIRCFLCERQERECNGKRNACVRLGYSLSHPAICGKPPHVALVDRPVAIVNNTRRTSLHTIRAHSRAFRTNPTHWLETFSLAPSFPGTLLARRLRRGTCHLSFISTSPCYW